MCNKILILLDLSYFEYVTIFGAVNLFQRKYPDDAKIMLRNAKEVDQNNLPNLLINEHFKTVLKKHVMKKLESLEWISKRNFQEEFDSASKIDFIFAIDDNLKHSFRKDLYPEYKAQRVLSPKAFNVYEIKRYITEVLFKELKLEEDYGYRFLSVEGAEGDDIIACVCKNLAKDYDKIVIYSSDRDFVQLENVEQYTLFGEKVECKVADIQVTPKEYLLCKILLGDGSDNISQVFPKVGPKKALKLIKDPEALKTRLKENQDWAKQFLLNKKLISFSEIPMELEKRIVEKANEVLYKNEVLNSKINLNDFMTL